MFDMEKLDFAGVIEREGGTLVGVQDGLFPEDESLVLLIFPEDSEPQAIPISKFTPEAVRAKRRKIDSI